MRPKQVKDLMKENPVIINPDTTLKQAAEKMRDIECGILPVGSGNSIDGMITDRDIVIRAVAQGIDISKAKVKDYMTEKIHACSETETLEEAASKMGEYNVSRLVVEDRAGRMTGILTFGAILRKDDDADEVSSVVKRAVHQHAA